MKVFISSVYEDARVESDRRHLQIRTKIERLGFWVRPQVDPWIAEYKVPGLNEQGWREIVDACVHALHDSDLMIVLLFRRAGSAVEIDSLGPSPVSVLEVELFHASLRRLPVLFFQAADFVPELRLAALITLLRRLTPSSHWFLGTEREIEAQVVDLLENMHRERRLPAGISGFCDALSDEVSFARVEREIASSRLSFLDGFAPGSPGPLSLDRVDLLLSEAADLAGTGQGTHVDRLSRLWFALRELAQLPCEALDEHLAARWVRLCELWTSAAAWLRLHGPLQLGVLATLHTRVQIRNAGFIPQADFPFGPFGSEAYSIAKASDTRDWKVRRFEAAVKLASKQIGLAQRDPSGAFGIRASAKMQLAQLGRPWLGVGGLSDYRRMLRTREKAGASDSEIGEAMAELGYAEFALARLLSLKGRAALARMREGVALLDGDHPERRPGFVARGKLKLAEALERSGINDEAERQRRDVEALRARHGLPGD
jgi:hypothetical protein